MTAGDRRLRVACVGAGSFSRVHHDSWSRIPRVECVAACDSNLQRAVATGLPAYDNVRAMICDVRPDVLDIILPPAAQAEVIRTALGHGMRTMICKAPFGHSLREAEALAAEVRLAGAQLIIHDNLRFQPWYRAIRKALDLDLLGEVQQAAFRVRPGGVQGATDSLEQRASLPSGDRFPGLETAVHFIDTFRYLFGDPVAVYADLRRFTPATRRRDAGVIILDHPDGMRTILDCNQHLDTPARGPTSTLGEALIEGTEASLRLSCDGALWLRRFGETSETCHLPPYEGANFGGDCVHALQVHVVDGLLFGSRLENIASDYLRVRRIEAAIHQSAREGRKIVLNAA